MVFSYNSYMIKFSLILSLILSLAEGHVTILNAEWFGGNSTVPIHVNWRRGRQNEDAGEAEREWGDLYTQTQKCKITINIEADAWTGKVTKHDTARRRAGMGYLSSLRSLEQKRMFLLYHEVAHCFDNYQKPEQAIVLRVWKESFADAFAVMVAKREGYDQKQLASAAQIRGDDPDDLSKAWSEIMLKALAVDVKDKTDFQLLEIAHKIRMEHF